METPSRVQPCSEPNACTDVTLRDIEMFRTFDGQVAGSLFPMLDHTVLRGGRPYLAALLRRPISDVVRLQERQRGMQHVSQSLAKPCADLRTLRRHEDDVRWFVRQRRAETAHPCFLRTRWLAFVNRHAAALAVYNFQRIAVLPAVNVLSPLVCVVIPYLMLKYKYGMCLPVAAYLRLLWKALLYGLQSNTVYGGVSMLLSVVFYFQNAFSACEVSATLRRTIHTVRRRMRGVRAFLAAANRVHAKAWDGCRPWFPSAPDPGSIACSGERGLLCDYQTTDPDAVERLADRMCMLDAVMSVVKARRTLGMCVPSWDARAGHKTFVLRGFWHPALSQETSQTVTRNTIDMTHTNVILTGANACGKSTVLKAVLTNAWLAHTLGICCAEAATFTPLHRIESHVHVPDRSGKASLFEAELARCADILRRGKSSPGHSLIVVDELFASTNPVEGVAAAHAAADAMGRMRGATTIISTHFTYLSTLEHTGKYVNMCMMAEVLPPEGPSEFSSGIVCDYVLRRGVSRQYLGLEVAAAKGAFDRTIMHSAIEMRKKITASHVRRRPS